MREARIESRNIPLRVGAPSAGGPRPMSRSRSASARGVRFNEQRVNDSARMNQFEILLPLVENVLQTAGYLVLTIGAAVLLFHFAP